jgi:predicted amidohydrolase
LKVILVQNNPQFGKVVDNLSAVSRLLSGRNERMPDLVVLPELFASGYQFVSRKEAMGLAEAAEGASKRPTFGFLEALSRETGGWVVGGLPVRRGDRVFNSAAVFHRGELKDVYDKTHLFEAENRWFDRGMGPLPVIETEFGTMGIMVCFDWLFPEVSRTLALKGARFIAHPVNWVLPFGPQGMILRAVENRVFMLTANRVGEEARGGLPPLRYIGSTQVVSPRGTVLGRAADSDEALLECEIDPGLADDKTVVSESDFFRQRRPELYS